METITLPAVRGSFGNPLQVAVAGDLVVAVNRADVLFSRDGGTTWELAPQGWALPLTETRVTALPDGTFLAVGILGTEPEAADPPRVAFRSSDGVTWTQRGDIGRGISVRDLIVLPDGSAVAVGASAEQDAAVWISRDGGGSWRAQELEGRRTGELVGAVALDDGVVLAAGPDNDGVAVWAGVP